ncbi:MAG TPA: hypothetical protein GXZ86_02430 [Clostridiales bacterium]|nr:hypothetical protein [Clostridiales bacterium]
MNESKRGLRGEGGICQGFAELFATKPSAGRFRYVLFESFFGFPPTKNHPNGRSFIGTEYR